MCSKYQESIDVVQSSSFSIQAEIARSFFEWREAKRVTRSAEQNAKDAEIKAARAEDKLRQAVTHLHKKEGELQEERRRADDAELIAKQTDMPLRQLEAKKAIFVQAEARLEAQIAEVGDILETVRKRNEELESKSERSRTAHRDERSNWLKLKQEQEKVLAKARTDAPAAENTGREHSAMLQVAEESRNELQKQLDDHVALIEKLQKSNANLWERLEEGHNRYNYWKTCGEKLIITRQQFDIYTEVCACDEDEVNEKFHKGLLAAGLGAPGVEKNKVLTERWWPDEQEDEIWLSQRKRDTEAEEAFSANEA